MTDEPLLNGLWERALAQLGGTAAIEASARELRAFLRGRAVTCATDLLRLILAYCLGGMGLRATSAWAASTGLAGPRPGPGQALSKAALLKRLRNSGAWMEHLAGKLLVAGAAPAARGRRIRLPDGTAVPKAGKEAKKNNGPAAPSLRLRSPFIPAFAGTGAGGMPPGLTRGWRLSA